MVNQVLPPLIDSMNAPCDPPDVIGRRMDLSTVMTCQPMNLSGMPVYTGVAEGNIDPAEYGGSSVQTQHCPTPYGDQAFDPEGVTRGGGSELDEMYLTSDGVNLYIGLTGNLGCSVEAYLKELPYLLKHNSKNTYREYTRKLRIEREKELEKDRSQMR